MSFRKIYGADLFTQTKEAIFILIFTQHFICLEALNSSKLQNVAKLFNAIFLWDALAW